MRGETCCPARGHVFVGSESAQRDSLYSMGIPQRPHQIEAASIRQAEIADHEIEMSLGGERSRPGSGSGMAHAESGIAQNSPEHVSSVLVVFHEKNLNV